LSAHTITAYRRDLTQFFDYANRAGVRSINDIDRRVIRRWLALLDTRGLARTTINRKASAVRTFLADLTRRGVLSHNPAGLVSSPRRPSTLPMRCLSGSCVRCSTSGPMTARPVYGTGRFSSWPTRPA